MNDLKKEQFLHKLIAGSAFVCALLILPIAQFALTNGGGRPEQGDVAGVSSDETITRQSIVTPECQAEKEQELYALDQWTNGKKQAMLHDHEEAVAPYRAGREALTGTPEQITKERAALDELIDAEYQIYLNKLEEVETAVAGQRQSIESRSCTTQ